MEKFNYNQVLEFRDSYKRVVNNIATVRLILFLGWVISFCLVDKYSFFYFVGFIFLFCFIICIFVHDKYYKRLDYYSKYLIVLDEYRARLDGDWRDFLDNGLEYSNELLSDLNIVGDNSLFQYLSVCSTCDGRDKLVSRLSNVKFSSNEFISNQKAISELVSNIDFDVKFLINMFKFRNKKIRLEDNFSFLEKLVGNKTIDLIVGLFFSFLCWFCLFACLVFDLSFKYFVGVLIFNFGFNCIYSLIFNEDFKAIDKVSSDYSKVIDVYNLVISSNFVSDKLIGIQNDIKNSNNSIKYLVFIDEVSNLSNNFLSSFIFNGLFSINVIVMFLYSLFQRYNSLDLKKGIVGISELEVLISLAGVGILCDNSCLPVLSKDVELNFSNLRHPLIDRKKVVGNDFYGKNGVNIITGSNMGGKTSFLRTIGINLILMNAGTYVCADSFSSCYFKIFTSISVSDDIDKGISTFYGELLRIKKAVSYNKGNRLLLIDEMFKGTNYNDRMYGAFNVIKKLNDDKTVLFITTHDFDVCDFDVCNLKNFYVKEYYEGDNIKFDYKIRNGKCSSTNAKYLMKKLNIID